MTTPIKFPEMCILCRPDYAPMDCPPAAVDSPGIGPVCRRCASHIRIGQLALHNTPGIASHMIPDGHRNNHHSPKPRNTSPSKNDRHQ